MAHVQDLLEKWNFGPNEPPLPGRVAARLGEVIARFRAALEREDRSAIQAVLHDLESLETALKVWTSVELDQAALTSKIED
jgi:hypothetical protein